MDRLDGIARPIRADCLNAALALAMPLRENRSTSLIGREPALPIHFTTRMRERLSQLERDAAPTGCSSATLLQDWCLWAKQVHPSGAIWGAQVLSVVADAVVPVAMLVSTQHGWTRYCHLLSLLSGNQLVRNRQQPK